MQKKLKKPKKRSGLRMLLGSKFYTARRFIKWHTGGISYAKKRVDENLPYTAYSHSTPLIRKLEKAKMELQYNKITNLRIAAGRINGIVLYPGEAFSYWKLIGRPTKKKGYLKGIVLESGNVGEGIGGGLCQLSNLIYWMSLHTELDIVERHRHSYDVFPDSGRTQPFGSGATCFYNYVDLMIKNNTNSIYRLCLNVGDTELAGAWQCMESCEFSYEVYEREHLIRHEFWGGYTRHNTIFRKKYYIAGRMVEDAFVTENHAIMMYEPLLENKEKLL